MSGIPLVYHTVGIVQNLPNTNADFACMKINTSAINHHYNHENCKDSTSKPTGHLYLVHQCCGIDLTAVAVYTTGIIKKKFNIDFSLFSYLPNKSMSSSNVHYQLC